MLEKILFIAPILLGAILFGGITVLTYTGFDKSVRGMTDPLRIRLGHGVSLLLFAILGGLVVSKVSWLWLYHCASAVPFGLFLCFRFAHRKVVARDNLLFALTLGILVILLAALWPYRT